MYKIVSPPSGGLKIYRPAPDGGWYLWRSVPLQDAGPFWRLIPHDARRALENGWAVVARIPEDLGGRTSPLASTAWALASSGSFLAVK